MDNIRNERRHDMEEFASFFNSENGSRIYNAQAMRNFIASFFNNGVFSGGFATTWQSGMTVEVSAGYANINGVIQYKQNPDVITLDVADATLSRVDTIVVELSEQDRDVTLKYVKGDGSAYNPTPKAPIRSDSVYQLVIAQIAVAAGSVAITQQDITDTRANTNLCGYISSKFDDINFEQLTAQFSAYFEETKAKDLSDFTTWFENDFNDIDDTTYNTMSDDVNLCESDASNLLINAGTLQGTIDDIEEAIGDTQTLKASGMTRVYHRSSSQAYPTAKIVLGDKFPDALAIQFSFTVPYFNRVFVKTLWLVDEAINNDGHYNSTHDASNTVWYSGFGSFAMADGNDACFVSLRASVAVKKTQVDGVQKYTIDCTGSDFTTWSMATIISGFGNKNVNMSLTHYNWCKPINIENVHRVDVAG